MYKVKVFQLAKKLDIPSKEFLYRLDELGIIVRDRMSTLADDEVARIEKAFAATQAEERQKKLSVRRSPNLAA